MTLDELKDDWVGNVTQYINESFSGKSGFDYFDNFTGNDDNILNIAAYFKLTYWVLTYGVSKYGAFGNCIKEMVLAKKIYISSMMYYHAKNDGIEAALLWKLSNNS